ncbi:MAG: hypothetical protein RL386_306, partial [Bacteroidota bacterium]
GCVKRFFTALRAKLCFERHVIFTISLREIVKMTCLSEEYSAAAGGKNLFTQPRFNIKFRRRRRQKTYEQGSLPVRQHLNGRSWLPISVNIAPSACSSPTLSDSLIQHHSGGNGDVQRICLPFLGNDKRFIGCLPDGRADALAFCTKDQGHRKT